MAQGIDSTKTPALPSHEAIENKPGSATMAGKSAQEKMDHMAMRGAKRAENRIKSDEGNIPGTSIFTK